MTNSMRKRRRELDITQEELARMAGITRGYVVTLENKNRKPSVEVALKIANALDCDVEDIFLRKT